MKYPFVVDKIKKVVYSCNTIEQLIMADNYCKLLINYLTDIKNNDPLEINIQKRDTRFSLSEWLKINIKKHKRDIIQMAD